MLDGEFTITAKTLSGLETVLAGELEALGAADIEPGNRVVTCSGDRELLYRAVLWLRTATRVLVPVARFNTRTEKSLYRNVRGGAWEERMGVDDTLAVDSVVSSPYFKHSGWVALKVKDAVVDRFRDLKGRRPNVDAKKPSLRINVHIAGRDCAVSLDASGRALGRRGYRLEGAEAPLSENLAAGMILLAGWRGERPFADPMCGSGTIAIEAAMIARRIAPGILRPDFACLGWPDRDERLWRRVFEDARRAVRPLEAPIAAADIDAEAIRLARRNAGRAFLAGDISFETRPIEESAPPAAGGVLVTNPPYGERLATDDIEALYEAIGDALKRHWTGWEAWVLSANTAALKRIGLRPEKRIPLRNGQLQCSFRRFTIYEGSRKRRGEEGDDDPAGSPGRRRGGGLPRRAK